MVGPFMQGMLLMGIIYWYSKGLFNLINDYYRSEFNRKIKTEISQQKIAEFRSQIYDLNDMDQLVNIEMNKETFTNDESYYASNESSKTDLPTNILNAADNMRICYRWNRKKQFFNILLTMKAKNEAITKSMCGLTKNITTYEYIYTNTNLYADIRNKNI